MPELQIYLKRHVLQKKIVWQSALKLKLKFSKFFPVSGVTLISFRNSDEYKQKEYHQTCKNDLRECYQSILGLEKNIGRYLCDATSMLETSTQQKTS